MKKFSQKRFSKDKQKDIVQQGKENIGKWRSYYKNNITYWKENVNFANGQQWEQDAKASYTNAGKVMLTFNKIRPQIRQILGEDRKFSVDVKLRNVSDNSRNNPQQEQQMDNEEKLRGLVRNIAYHSSAYKTYNHAYQDALEGGFGAWRVIVWKEGTHNELRIEDINNPLCAFWDSNAKSSCKTDGDFAGVVTYISKKEFECRYPNTPYPETSQFTPASEYNLEWGTSDRIAIIEEYRRETYTVKRFFSEFGQEFDSDEVQNDPSFAEMRMTVKKEKRSRIVHYKYTDHHLLEKSETPFMDLPVIFVGGYIRLIDGIETIYSYHDDARDAQRELNFIGSDIAEWLKITKKTKFLAPARQVDRYIKSWNNPDRADSALLYDPDGAPGYKPESISPPSMPSDLVAQYQRTELDIRMALGRYDPNIGKPQEQGESGVAIFNQAIQGNSTIEIFRENRNAAIAETGKIILNAIPRVYDDTRQVTITGDNDEEREIRINTPQFNPMSMSSEFVPTFPDNSYSVEIDVGQSFPMQKAENARLAMELIRADTTGRAYPLLAEFIAENLDTSKASRMASRLRTLVPPNVIMQEDNPKQAEMIQQQQMQAGQQQQMQEQQMQQLAMKNAEIDIATKMHKMMDDHTKAMAAHQDSMANMMKALTERYEAMHKQSIAGMKATAEIDKSQNEAMKSKYELGKQVLEDMQPRVEMSLGER